MDGYTTPDRIPQPGTHVQETHRTETPPLRNPSLRTPPPINRVRRVLDFGFGPANGSPASVATNRFGNTP